MPVGERCALMICVQVTVQMGGLTLTTVSVLALPSTRCQHAWGVNPSLLPRYSRRSFSYQRGREQSVSEQADSNARYCRCSAVARTGLTLGIRRANSFSCSVVRLQ